ncbi:MAG: hypothetical protein IT367_21170 [Candidatus Hydrogenedentes bacterium]|nr:hypothetical protein [Candidatus Hydrogenedentota bacterium]
MEFKPWIDFKSDEIPVDAPPCPFCIYWNPKKDYKVYDGKVIYDGVTLCHSEEWHNDFSCYRAKK